jgi:ribulose-phosphate 3-epimerase
VSLSDILISTSILSADFSRLAEQIQAGEDAGIDWIHVDVMDGQFVPNITMGPFIVETVRKITPLPIDVHLMIEYPERHIKAFADAGANHISIHIENNPNVYRTLQELRELSVHPGIVINPGTPAASIAGVIDSVDMVLVMTVNPGFSGQNFIPQTVSKVAEVKNMLESHGSQALIEVDGGITAETIPLVYRAGARVIVAATAIFKHPGGISAGVRALRNAAG